MQLHNSIEYNKYTSNDLDSNTTKSANTNYLY